MSISQIILLGNWIIEGKYKEKLGQFKSNLPALFIVIFYLLHVLWLFNTNDFQYAMKDLRVKLPLLILPFVLSSGIQLSKEEFKRVLQIYIAAIVLASLTSMMKLWGLIGEPINDTRKMSFIISHIRFGLMINMAIFCAVWLGSKTENLSMKVAYLTTVVWLIVFLGIMTGLTALLVLFILTALFSIYHAFISQNKKVAILIAIVCVSIPIITAFLSVNEYNRQFTILEASDIAKLETTTPYGNNYYHSPSSVSIENGRYVYRYICEKEVEEAWNKRASIKWGENNKKGQDIKGAMYRFLTSKGLRKDKEGIDALTDEEIKAIENRVTSIDLMDANPLYKRFHQTIWEIGSYKLGIPPGGSSLTQRFEFWKAAISIGKQNFWFGVGTGDVPLAFEDFYEKQDFGLGKKYQKRTHNQYLTFLVSFGVFGFIFFLISMIYPMLTEQHVLFYLFMGIALMSFLNEDTLESQAGATFFAGFFGLLLNRITPENKPA